MCETSFNYKNTIFLVSDHFQIKPPSVFAMPAKIIEKNNRENGLNWEPLKQQLLNTANKRNRIIFPGEFKCENAICIAYNSSRVKGLTLFMSMRELSSMQPARLVNQSNCQYFSTVKQRFP
jgi:hypothetical protein